MASASFMSGAVFALFLAFMKADQCVCNSWHIANAGTSRSETSDYFVSNRATSISLPICLYFISAAISFAIIIYSSPRNEPLKSFQDLIFFHRLLTEE